MRLRIFESQQRNTSRTTQTVQFLEKPSQKWTKGRAARMQPAFELQDWVRDGRAAKNAGKRGGR